VNSSAKNASGRAGAIDGRGRNGERSVANVIDGTVISSEVFRSPESDCTMGLGGHTSCNPPFNGRPHAWDGSIPGRSPASSKVSHRLECPRRMAAIDVRDRTLKIARRHSKGLSDCRSHWPRFCQAAPGAYCGLGGISPPRGCQGSGLFRLWRTIGGGLNRSILQSDAAGPFRSRVAKGKRRNRRP